MPSSPLYTSPAGGSTETGSVLGISLIYDYSLAVAVSVYDELLTRIVLGDYAPGSPLHEKELASELGVSRTPVREALLRLAEWCERFSPGVGLEDSEKPQGLLLDVTGLGPLFGGEGCLARQVVRKFRRRGLLFYLRFT